MYCAKIKSIEKKNSTHSIEYSVREENHSARINVCNRMRLFVLRDEKRDKMPYALDNVLCTTSIYSSVIYLITNYNDKIILIEVISISTTKTIKDYGRDLVTLSNLPPTTQSDRRRC